MFRSLLAFILILTSVTESLGNTCGYLFSRPLDAIEQVNRSNNGYLSSDASVQYKIMMLKQRHQKKAQKLLDRVYKGDIASEKDLHRLSEELTLLLYGHRSVIDNYFFKSKDQRQTESIRHIVRTQLMENGLKSFIETQPRQLKASLWIQIKKNVRRVLQSRVLNWVQVPWGLPHRANKIMEETLVQKIIWDGITAHQKEVDRYFEGQNRVEIHNIVRRIYSLVIIGVLAGYGYQTQIEKQNIESRKTVELISTQLDHISTNLPKEVQAFRVELREDALESAIRQYKEELKREPTAEEIEEMRQIIFED